MPRASHRAVNVLGADPTPDDRSITFEVLPLGGGWGRPKGYRGFVRIPLGFTIPTPTGPAPAALMTLGPKAATPQAAAAAANMAAAKAATTASNTLSKVMTNPLVQAGLSQVPGGQLAATLIANPAVQNAAKAVASKLKFW
ncbi:MAG TPA: hypothetical protein VIV56_14780 [Gemmatimonadales bacterium]